MIFTTFCSITFILIKLAEKKQKKKNAGHQNDETVVHSSNNAPVDDSQKALTGDVFLAKIVQHAQTTLFVKSFPRCLPS